MKLREKHKGAILKAALDTMFKYFCVVVVVLIVVNWGSAWFADGGWALYSQGLVSILLIALCGILPTLLVEVLVETTSAKGVRTKNAIRFITTAALVLGVYGMIQSAQASAQGGISLRVIGIFLLVYGGVNIYSYFNATTIEIEENNLAEKINQRLNEFHHTQNETHQG